MIEHGKDFTQWLSEPVKVLRSLNTAIAVALLVAGLVVPSVGGLILAYLGTVAIIQLRRA